MGDHGVANLLSDFHIDNLDRWDSPKRIAAKSQSPAINALGPEFQQIAERHDDAEIYAKLSLYGLTPEERLLQSVSNAYFEASQKPGGNDPITGTPGGSGGSVTYWDPTFDTPLQNVTAGAVARLITSNDIADDIKEVRGAIYNIKEVIAEAEPTAGKPARVNFNPKNPMSRQVRELYGLGIKAISGSPEYELWKPLLEPSNVAALTVLSPSIRKAGARLGQLSPDDKIHMDIPNAEMLQVFVSVPPAIENRWIADEHKMVTIAGEVTHLAKCVPTVKALTAGGRYLHEPKCHKSEYWGNDP